MATYTFSTHVAAPIEVVFDLDGRDSHARMGRRGPAVTDISGPVQQVGTRYVTRFGRMKSPTEVIEADRPRLFATRFGNAVLRGTNRTVLVPDGEGTRITQTFQTVA